MAAELNVLDRLYLHLDKPDEPFSVQFEVELSGRLDDERLAQAVRAAAANHPIARARLADWRGTDTTYRWEIADELDELPLEVVDCDNEVQLDAARERLFGACPTLDAPPPFALTLAHGPDGDTLMLNLHHGAGDGLSAARLMSSILRAYGGEDDPLGPVDSLAVRKVEDLIDSGSVAAFMKRGRALVEEVAKMAATPARVAPDGGATELPGYGFELLRLEPGEAKAVIAKRRGEATVNDVLLGALAVTLRRWNEQHGAETGRIALMMPVNLRPPEWRSEVIANFASYVTVSLAEDEQEGIDAAIDAAADRTRHIKEHGIAGLIVDLLALPAPVPLALRRNMQHLIPITGDRVVATAVLSNLGRLDALPELDAAAGEPRAVWFSPPGRMPLGTSFGAATLGDDMFVTLRYRHALLSPDAASQLLGLYREVLAG